MQNSCLKNFVKLWRNICDFALGILEFSASLRGFEKKGAIPFKIPSLRKFRHCEGAKQREQSLGILNLFLGILNSMSSPSLTGGSLC